jgi:hypothetical protein
MVAPGSMYAKGGVINNGILTQNGVTNFTDVVNSEQTIVCRNDITATGSIYYGTSMIPLYFNLPSLTIEQIGGNVSMNFIKNHTYTTGFGKKSV